MPHRNHLRRKRTLGKRPRHFESAESREIADDTVTRRLTRQKRDRLTFAMLHLVHCALAKIFVRTPAQKSCAVSKPAAGKMIIGDFHDNFWRDWLPFAGALRAPTARSSRRVAGETGWFSQS